MRSRYSCLLINTCGCVQNDLRPLPSVCRGGRSVNTMCFSGSRGFRWITATSWWSEEPYLRRGWSDSSSGSSFSVDRWWHLLRRWNRRSLLLILTGTKRDTQSESADYVWSWSCCCGEKFLRSGDTVAPSPVRMVNNVFIEVSKTRANKTFWRKTKPRHVLLLLQALIHWKCQTNIDVVYKNCLPVEFLLIVPSPLYKQHIFHSCSGFKHVHARSICATTRHTSFTKCKFII